MLPSIVQDMEEMVDPRTLEEGNPVTALTMRLHPDSAAVIVEDDLSEVLHRIAEPLIDLTLWHRPLPSGVEKWLLSLSSDHLPCGRILARREEFESALDQILEASATSQCNETTLFVSDVVEIATLFADIAETELVDIGLDVVEHDSCWKFHRDHVRLRALTTYFGPGTKYVSDDDADRAVAEQREFKGSVHKIPKHTVALFKGAKDVKSRGVVHRSPPIVGTGQTRLVLTLNLPSEVSPAYPNLERIRFDGGSA